MLQLSRLKVMIHETGQLLGNFAAFAALQYFSNEIGQLHLYLNDI